VVDKVDFNAPAEFRKWPSLKNERVAKAWGGRAYLVFVGTLAQCISEFASRPHNTSMRYIRKHRQRW
jgi:hypothetical protein